MDIIFALILGFWVVIPAYAANGFAPFARGKRRIDFSKNFFDGKPIFGPGKTWEGFIFGLIITILIAWPVSLWIDFPGTTGWIIIGILISVTGTLGDLVESMLKRKAGVKDSGSLLPGHGGLLDRFDSLILSLPFVFIYLTIFG